MQKSLSSQNQTTTAENVELASSWIKNCREKHKCGAWSEGAEGVNTWVPTRLVDVGKLKSPTLKVVHSSETQDPYYCTLTHVWGPIAARHSLRKNNLQEWCTSIPEDSGLFPKTFHQAFNMTRLLGLRYIWIDSMCIMQDNADDWAREASQMSTVYGHSSLNILAASATDSGPGLNSKRLAFTVRPCCIRNPFSAASAVSFLVFPSRLSTIFQEQVDASIISQRAWIVQERLLAPRSLFFATEQLVWSCGELEACESFPNGVNVLATRPHRQLKNDKQLVSLILGTQSLGDYGTRSQRLAEAWSQVARMYSAGQLSFAKDRAVALSGVAERTQSRMQGRYLAGHWQTQDREAFLWSLLWSIDSHPWTSSTDYIAPSWSWLSALAKVDIPTPDPLWRRRRDRLGPVTTYESTWQVTVIACEVSLTRPSDLYGMLTGGYLKLECCKYEAFISPVTSNEEFASQFFTAELEVLCLDHNVVVPARLDQGHYYSVHIDGDCTWVVPFVTLREIKRGQPTGLTSIQGLIVEPGPATPADTETEVVYEISGREARFSEPLNIIRGGAAKTWRRIGHFATPFGRYPSFPLLDATKEVISII